MASVERPEILLLSLAFQSFLDDTYSSLFDSLSNRAQLKRAKSTSAAIRYLEANNPELVLVTDGSLTKKENRAVLEKLKSYLQNGGLVIFGLQFPSSTRMDAFDKLFNESFGLPWKSGDYHRATFQFNPSCTLPTSVKKDSFPSPYSMKALHVKDSKRHERIFVPTPGGTTQSHVFLPAPVDETQAAVVGAKVGNGFLIYAGDVNSEVASNEVILALCGF
jgi:hypothetical protein